MNASEHASDLELVDVTDERVLAALQRVDSMSYEQLRELAEGEDPSVVEAAEAMIARRQPTQREAI
jgi:hypothetical protein